MKNRIKKLQELMIKDGIKQIVVYDYMSIFYLTGIKTKPTLFFQALLVNSNKDAELVYYYIQRYNLVYKNIENVKMVTYSQYEDGVDFFAKRISSSKVLLDKKIPLGFASAIQNKVNLTFELDYLVDSIREIKDEQEINYIKEASKISDDTIFYAKSLLKPGISEKQLQEAIIDFIKKSGADGVSFTPFVMFDIDVSYNSGNTDRVFTKNSYAMIDLGARYKGYCGDTTRMYFHRSNVEEVKLYKQVLEANMAAIASIKEGISFEDVDKEDKKVLNKYGILDYNYFPTGHSVGLSIHELDYVMLNNKKLLKEGMVFSVEPGVYIQGKIGARVEDLVLVKKNGCEVLNHTSKEDIFLD
ncbi:MAG: Xaa-Pro peptidase family protein [Bacilli bacterium]|nr:Xaa-Pro peptidase family protein [Bacilli bacterium]